MEGCIDRFMCSVISRYISHADYGSRWSSLTLALMLSFALNIMWLPILKFSSFWIVCATHLAALLLQNKEKKYIRDDNWIPAYNNFTCLQLSTLTPKLIQAKFFLVLTSAKEKKITVKIVVPLRWIDLQYSRCVYCSWALKTKKIPMGE